MADTNRPQVLLGVIWSGAALAVVFTAARLYTRMRLEPKLFGWDDGTMVVALVLHLAGVIILSMAVQAGLGYHQSTLNSVDAVQAMRLQWFFQPPDVLSNTVARISISIFLIRVFPRKQAMKIGLISLATLNTLAAIVGLTMIFTQCKPAAVLWDPSIHGAECLPSSVQVGLAVTKASIGAVSDVVTAGWPSCIIWKLKMATRRKVLLGMLFALSLLACLTCIMEALSLSANGNRSDETYLIAGLDCWTASAAAVLIIVGNLPALVPLYFRYMKPELLNDRSWPAEEYSLSKRASRSAAKNTVKSAGAGFDDRTWKNSVDQMLDEPGAYGTEASAIHKTTQVDVHFEGR